MSCFSNADVVHCGPSCTVCPSPPTNEVAVCNAASTCATTCDLALTRCAGTCRNLLTDITNCGACGMSCGAGQTCSAGHCVQPCTATYSWSCGYNPLPTNLAPLDLKVADFDHDGISDYAIALGATAFSTTSQLRLFKSNSGGNFNSTGTPDGAITQDITSFDVGDLNNDGLLDIATIEPSVTPPRLNIYLASSPWTFSSSAVFTISDASADVRIADLDGDGRRDIIVTYRSFPTSYSPVIYFNTGTTFSATSIGLDVPIQRPLVYDYDQDGLPDLLSVLYPGCPIVFRQNASHGFDTITGSCGQILYSAGFAFLDVNQDGKLDMAALNQSSDLSLYMGDSYPYSRFGSPTAGTTPISMADMKSIDLNLDGFGDLVGATSVYLGLGGSAFQFAVGTGGTTSGTFTEMIFLDRNGDRFPDWAFGVWGDSTGMNNRVYMCNSVCQ